MHVYEYERTCFEYDNTLLTSRGAGALLEEELRMAKSAHGKNDHNRGCIYACGVLVARVHQERDPARPLSGNRASIVF